MSVYLYNSLRFALLERGLLHLLKGLVPIPISIRFKLVTNENISALLVATYLCVKLKKTYTMGMLLKSLKTVLLSEYNIDGFRIKYSGRFNRKPRATRASLRGGSMSCSTLSSKIDYVERLVILKFGICAIKVWLNKGKNFPEVLGKFYLK
jgi:ribosomal protein S3